MSVSDRRLRSGRLSLYVEPRDLWVGAFVGPSATYVCPLPGLVLRWARGRRARPGRLAPMPPPPSEGGAPVIDYGYELRGRLAAEQDRLAAS